MLDFDERSAMLLGFNTRESLRPVELAKLADRAAQVGQKSLALQLIRLAYAIGDSCFTPEPRPYHHHGRWGTA